MPSVADARVSDTVDFEVLEEVKVGNLLVIPKSSAFHGALLRQSSGRGGKRTKIRIEKKSNVFRR